MTPREIQQLKQRSSKLEEALNDKRCWQFLREVRIHGDDSIPCIRCAKETPRIETDYIPDLCIDCVLHELLIVGPLQQDVYRDPRSRYYDADYDQECKLWDNFYSVPDDYDGPPIVMG